MFAPDFLLAEHETGWRFTQPRADAHLRDTIPERVLHALEQRLALLERLFLALAIRLAGERAELEVTARDILEALAFECVRAAP